MKIPFKITDVRSFDPKAVSIANQLGSTEPLHYRQVEDWLKANKKLADYSSDTLVELFERDGGSLSQNTPSSARKSPKP